jgi:hypothetical protein
MTTTGKRLTIIALVSVLLVLFIFGQGTTTHPTIAQTEAATQAAPAGTQAANLPATKPVIRAELNGAELAGLVGSSCWPNANPECDFVDEPQPTQSIAVANGDTLTFKPDPDAPAPQSFEATLLDDKDASGNNPIVNLAETKGEFKVDKLTPGNHRLQIVALYAGDLAGSQPFVTYVYLLNVGEAVAAAASPAATEVPTEAVTPEATTAEATAQATPEATTAVTEVATVEPTVVPTTTPEVATIEATTALTTPEATTAAPTAAPTMLAIAAATQAVQPTLAASPVPPTATPLPVPTDTLIPSPEAPTATSLAGATLEPTLGATPVVVIVTATPGGTSVAPASTVIVAGRSYEPIAISACVLGEGGEQTCGNRPRNAAAERIFAAPGDVAQINFKGPRPTSVVVSVATADGTTILNKATLAPDNLMLYALPTTPGSYILAVEISWPLGKSTYYYRLTIGS